MRRIRLWVIVLLMVLSCHNISMAKQVSSDALSKPAIGSVFATSKSTIRLVWIPVKGAQQYEVYRSKSKKKGFECIGTTKKTSYTDKKGKALTTYYYKIRAVRKNAATGVAEYSPYSITMKKKMRKIVKTTAYAGDSLMVGLLNYGKITDNHKQKVFAKIGIGTQAYYESDLLTQLLAYKPDRLFIMLGVNDIAGNPTEKQMDNMIRYYKAILKSCVKKNPDMEIFVLGVSPVGKSSSVSLNTINYYNRKMERQVVPLDNVYYYDLCLELAGNDGYLKPEYVAGDGLHWTSKTYDTVLKAMKEMVKEY